MWNQFLWYVCYLCLKHCGSTDRLFHRGRRDAALKEALTPHVFETYQISDILLLLLTSEHLFSKNMRLHLKENSFECRHCSTKQILVTECRANRKINSSAEQVLLNVIIFEKQCQCLILFSQPPKPNSSFPVPRVIKKRQSENSRIISKDLAQNI